MVTDAQPKTIDGRARTVRELLDKARYSIDFYQREYAWQERQVRELIDDLSAKFLDSWEEGHARHEVEGYGHYFLGSIVISHKRGQRFIVDGQQRLTTLTLLLMHLHRLQEELEDRVDVRDLVYSEKFGRKSFNLDVPERANVMQQRCLGWGDDSTWPCAIEKAFEAMWNRYRLLVPQVRERRWRSPAEQSFLLIAEPTEYEPCCRMEFFARRI
ncbi:MAG: DUF262 domain-containing protein [Planctomycetota bacterium]